MRPTTGWIRCPSDPLRPARRRARPDRPLALNGIAAGYRRMPARSSAAGTDAVSYATSARGRRTLTIWGCALTGAGLALALGLWWIGTLDAGRGDVRCPARHRPVARRGLHRLLHRCGAPRRGRVAVERAAAMGSRGRGFRLGLSLALWPKLVTSRALSAPSPRRCISAPGWPPGCSRSLSAWR